MLSTNGCCAHSPVDRLAGVMSGPKPTIEPEKLAFEQRGESYNACDAGFLRAHPAEVLDLVATGRTIEICVDYARSADPIAVLMPWAVYNEFVSMRDRIAAITGPMQPSRAG